MSTVSEFEFEKLLEELETLRASSTIKQANIEQLETENERLKTELLCLTYDRDALLAERDNSCTNAQHHGCAFKGWQCFHCGEIFTTVGGARDHFGADPSKEPGCMIKVKYGDERGLAMELRKVEGERDKLLAERDQMMKQEPYAYVHIDADGDDAFYEEIQKTEPNCEPIKHLSWSDDLTDSFSQEFIDFKAENGKPLSVMPLYASPLPAQQINILDMGMDQPASMRRCVQKLIEAAGILLDDKNYDGTGHELISDARNNAIKYLADHKPAQQIPEGYALVPTTPTPEMEVAFHKGCGLEGWFYQGYEYMLSASQPKGES